jgi:hypothetical protein
MPDVGSELVAAVSVSDERPLNWLVGLTCPQLDEEFRYLQRKKKVVKELAETRIRVSPSFGICLIALIAS